jgi:GT2 family glycosyltransferase
MPAKMIASIIVAYNGIQWYEKCFSSLLNSTIPNEIIVVDNASNDDTIKFIKEKYPEIQLIVNDENLGFAKANNIGIEYALRKGADYIFLLNQDAWIEKDTLSTLINVFHSVPDAGIVSPIHLNGSNTGLDLGFVDYISRYNTPDFISDLFIGKLNSWYKTNFINAAAWLLSRKCIEKVGGFDTSLFYHYGEDDNYCQRVCYHNFGIYISTAAKIYHDREVRMRGYENYEKQRLLASQPVKVRLGNILEDDIKIDEEISALKNRFIRKIIYNILMFRFDKIKKMKTDMQNEIKLYAIIKKSRKANKHGNMIWLNDIVHQHKYILFSG